MSAAFSLMRQLRSFALFGVVSSFALPVTEFPTAPHEQAPIAQALRLHDELPRTGSYPRSTDPEAAVLSPSGTYLLAQIPRPPLFQIVEPVRIPEATLLKHRSRAELPERWQHSKRERAAKHPASASSGLPPQTFSAAAFLSGLLSGVVLCRRQRSQRCEITMSLVAAGPHRCGARKRSSGPDPIASTPKDPLKKYPVLMLREALSRQYRPLRTRMNNIE